MAGDWIRLHRKLLDSAVFSDEWLLRLWVWCLLRAGYCDRNIGGFTVPAGSFLTGRFAAADELNVSPSKWYRGIHQLASFGMISLSANKERTTVTVCNWTTYQSRDDVREQQVNSERTASEQQVNNKRTTDEQQMNTREEGKECKEGEELVGIPPRTPLVSPNGDGKPKRSRKPRAIVTYSPDFERFWIAFPDGRKTNKPDAFKCWPDAVEDVALVQHVEPAQAVDWLVQRATDYDASDQGRGQYVRMPATWIRAQGYNDPPEAWKNKQEQRNVPGPGQRWTEADEQRAQADRGSPPEGTIQAGRCIG